MPLISSSGINKLEKVQLNFLRRLVGVPRTAASKHIYAETGRLPDSTFWWQQSLRYMHHLTALDDNHLVHRAFTAFVQDLGWGQAVRARLSPLGFACRMELTSTLELAAQPWPRQLRQPS